MSARSPDPDTGPDLRLPLRLTAPGSALPDEIGPARALLVEGERVVPAGLAHARFTLPAVAAWHRGGCLCCAPRGPAAAALARLFLARARGEVAFFSEILALPETAAGAAAIRAALAEDMLTRARWRLVEGGGLTCR